MRRKWIAIFCAATLLTGCAESAPDPAIGSTAETTGAAAESENAAALPDTYSWTEDELRNISDADLIALGREPYVIGLPAVCDNLPPGLITRLPLLVETESAADAAEADAIVAKRIGEDLLAQQPVIEDDAGRWWHYIGSAGVSNDLLVFDKAFLDLENAVLHADVTEENLLMLTAIQCYERYDIPCLGAFVEDEGGSFRCTQYYLQCTGGDDGMSDTVLLYAYSFYADKETGVLEGYPFAGLPDARAEYIKELEIPDTVHSYPDDEDD